MLLRILMDIEAITNTTLKLLPLAEKPQGDQHYVTLHDISSESVILTAKGACADMALQLVEAELSHFTEVSSLQSTRSDFYDLLLTKQLSPQEINTRSKRLHINNEVPRIAFIVELPETDLSMALQAIGALLPSVSSNTFFPITDSRLVLIHDLGTVTPDKLAHNIADTLQAELMTNIRVAYGAVVKQLNELRQSYQDAEYALSVADIFFPERKVIAYDHLGIGQLIYSIPKSRCRSFLREQFGEKNLFDLLDSDTLQIIHQFFAHNLNIGETAKSLFMHRNTLTYRLEKINKITGFDLRKFDDAMNFKIALMIHTFFFS